jgi:16S rRNA (uracil1498-N3)-methyltransferase
MQLFYASLIEDNSCTLNEEESWHCMKVLRLGIGDSIDLTDGAGIFYRGRLVTVHHKKCLVEIITKEQAGTKNWHLHIALAPTKNIDRFEWFLEKATEIGVTEITPMFSEHSERTIVKLPRLEKVIISAMKQSLKAWLPVLNEPASFREVIAGPRQGQKFIGYCETGMESELHDKYLRGSNALILIGPEGDFSRNEVAEAVDAGITPITLGPERMRTETAGVVACHTINLLNRMA